MVIWCEFRALDQNHSREDPGGLTMCHKSGWTAEKGAEGMIQNFVLRHSKEERGIWDTPVTIALCPRPAVGGRPCSAPTTISASGNQGKMPSLQTICYLWHSLVLFFLLISYFLGTQLNAGPVSSPTTPCSAVILQPKTRGLSHLDNLDYQEASRHSSQQEPASPATTPGPAASTPISSRSAPAARCRTSSAAKSRAPLQC